MGTSPKTGPLREAISHIFLWPRTLRLVWGAAPRWTLAWAVLLVVQGILPAAYIYVTKLLVDSLTVAVQSGGWGEIYRSLMLVALLAGVTVLIETIQNLIEWIRAAQSELIQDHIKSLIHRQAAAVDLSFYESADCHDQLEQARHETVSRPLALLESGGTLIQNGITLLTMASLLLAYSAWLPVLLVIGTLPALYVVVYYDRLYHNWWKRTTAQRRRTQYYDLLLTHEVAAAEIRLFGLAPYIQKAYGTVRRQLRSERLKLIRNQSLAKLCASSLGLFISGVALAWMIWRAPRQSITLGDLALFYQAFSRGQGLMRSLLGNLGQIYSSTLYLGNLFGFLDLRPGITDPPRPVPAPANLRQGIHFRDVTFYYPGSDRPALKDFTLYIPAGKITSIVGVNGAGKTTLLKLLCRFYDPQKGRIELDGVDIRNFAVDDLRRRITMLFQFPLNYQSTVFDNIAAGDTEAKPDLASVKAAARNAGAHDLIVELPHGYDTLLGKAFADGVELSGGEWQRIATARAYLRQSPIILLDEPTSMMDSWTEADWFDRFRALARGRTAIIITHRFTVAMRADLIHVMHGGRIIESGTHESLIKRDGPYAQSWQAQHGPDIETEGVEKEVEAVLERVLINLET
jgi:ATP-binding cassette subfamily B protein